MKNSLSLTLPDIHEAIAQSLGLSGTDHKYLGFILQKGEMTAGELSIHCGLTTGAITGIIDRLEKKKFIKRKYLTEDRRKVVLIPNHEKIKTTIEPIFKNLQKLTDQLISTFSEKELEVIYKYFLSATDIMNHIRKNLKEI